MATGVTLVNSTKITAYTPVLTPGTLNDVVVTSPGHQGGKLENGLLAYFLDVPGRNMFHIPIEKVVRDGVSGGCSGGNYCPDNGVTRAQMAVFLLRGEHGGSYLPPPATGQVFNDVATDSFAAAWIEQLSAEGITGGCGGGNYCPDAIVTRAQMAVFLLRTEHGSSYVPPPATGIFADLLLTDPFTPWIEELYREGIAAGCGGGNYCPNDSVTRGQMAVFLTQSFNLM